MTSSCLALRRVKDPTRCEVRNVAGVDLLKSAVPVASGLSVVGGPIARSEGGRSVAQFRRSGDCRRPHEESDEILQLLPACAYRGHERLRFPIDCGDLTLVKKMHDAVESEELQIEVALVPDEPANGAVFDRADGYEMHRCCGGAERLFDLSEGTLAAEFGELGAENAAASLDHVTRGAVAFAEEELRACGGIARHGFLHRRCGEMANEGKNGLQLGFAELEGRHAGFGYAFCDDVMEGFRGPAALRNVRAALAPCSIGAVACRTVGFKEFPAGVLLRIAQR